MKKILFITLLLSFGAIFLNDAKAYNNEVYYRNGYYRWKINGTEIGGTSSLAKAINNCIGSGGREVHVLTDGKLWDVIYLQASLKLYFHNHTLTKTHSGEGFFRDGSGGNYIMIYDLILYQSSGYGIHTSRASNINFNNIRIYGGGIGIRVDSHPSRPYEDGRWVYNVRVYNCRFENCSSHGLETYGVQNFTGDYLVSRNCGDCGVLFNKTYKGKVGTVNSYRCDYGGGYAGLRFANSCASITVDKLYADKCGRGLFVLTGSKYITVKYVKITDCSDIGIWVQDCDYVHILSGSVNCGVAITGYDSYANVTKSASAQEFSLNENENGSYKVYPTVVESMLNVISNNEEMDITNVLFYDNSGKLVLQETVTGSSNTINLTDLPAGVYYVNISGSNETVNTKIVKK